MPAIRIDNRDYEEVAVRRIRDTVSVSVAGSALPSNAATETTLVQVRDAIKAQIDLESTIWTDNSGAYYVRRDLVDEGTGAITIAWTAPDGSPATPGAGLKPLASADRDVTQELYEATASGTGYSSGNLLARLLVLDVSPATPAITEIWYNLAAGATLAAPNPAHVRLIGDAVTISSSALPAGAATEAKQDTLIGHVDGLEGLLSTIDADTGAIDGKLPSGLTVSSNRLKVDGSEVTQPISAVALPLPAGAATEVKQDTGNSSLSAIDTKLPSGLTVASNRLKVDGSEVTQPISAVALPLPAGAASEAKQDVLIGHVDGLEGLLSTIDADTGAIDAKLPSGLTVSSNRLKVDGSEVTQPTSVAVRTPTTTSVASSATSVTILAANSNRRGFSISNISAEKLYLSFTAPASTANCFIEVPPGAFLLLDQQLMVTNAIYGLWAAANGAAQVTEYV